jgi:hypothetical protein
MTSVDVRRWHNRYRVTRPGQAERIASWDAALGEAGMHASLPELHDDEWICVRRLRLALRLREDDGVVQAREAWSASLAAELARELREGGGDNVVRYRDRREALADLLYRASVGDLRRAWAWRRMGLLHADDAGDGGEAARRVAIARAVEALVAQPLEIWPLLAHLLHAEGATGAWTALVASLDEAHWDALLEASPRTRTLHRASMRVSVAAPVGDAAPRNAFGSSLMAWIAARRPMASRHERVLAVLLAADAVQGAIDEARAAAQVRSALARVRRIVSVEPRPPGDLRGRAPGRDESMPVRSPAHGMTTLRSMASASPETPHGAPRSSSAAEAPARGELPAAPPLPERVEALATEWAGLLFVLNLLPVEAIDGAGDALAGALWRLAVVHLAVPAQDPVVRAFCGGSPPPGETDARIDTLAADFDRAVRVTLEERLRAAMDGEGDLVEFVCRRRGELRFEPGWIELAMAADAADARLRRAALDLDPGWLPWLGCVVRFRYE